MGFDVCTQSPRLRFHCSFYSDNRNIVNWRELGREENLLSLWYADFSLEPAGWHFQCTPKHGPADGRVRGTSGGGGGSHGKITERQLGITKDPPFVAISPFLCCSPAPTTIFLQRKTVNVPFAGLRYYEPVEVCEEASQTCRVFVLRSLYHAPGNRSLLPPWKLLLILITPLLGMLQLPRNITLKSTALDFLKDRVSASLNLVPTTVSTTEPTSQWLSRLTAELPHPSAWPRRCRKRCREREVCPVALWGTARAVGGERSWSPAAPARLGSAEQTDIAGVRMG